MECPGSELKAQEWTSFSIGGTKYDSEELGQIKN